MPSNTVQDTIGVSGVLCYIGYTEQVNGQTVTYAGLLPGHTITIDVPLVF